MSRKGSSLGRSLMRDHKKKNTVTKKGFRHVADLSDGFDWACLNLRSVTEQSSVNDFIDQVKLAESDYNKEFANIQILSPDEAAGILSEEEKKSIQEAQEQHRHVLSIPRRPPWRTSDTKELDVKEREEFLRWRRKLALLREEKHLSLTPYEMNLEIWRQLWRVIEKSDVIVQIIDARNPLLFRCEDLEAYVKEVDEKKHNLLLLNKADFLSEKQREMWATYFQGIGVKVVFFSALQQSQKAEELTENDDKESCTDSEEEEEEKCARPVSESTTSEDPARPENSTQVVENEQNVVNSSRMLSKSELVSFLKSYRSMSSGESKTTMAGMVGYPNVGKSSTINAVLSSKKVQVSATPGKTKHFQTLMVDSELCFCDCPGLVFPNFVSTKAEMVVNGILPVDQLTDHISPVTLVTNLIPRRILESTYSIMIPPPAEGKDPSGPPTAEEFLNAYGYMRGFVTKLGLPDNARSARYVLKDFIKGKLLYCFPPPAVDEKEYQEHSIRPVPETPTSISRQAVNVKTSTSNIDRNFFRTATNQAHVKGTVHVSGYSNTVTSLDSSSTAKPWKKHHNRNKKEKLRRIYSET